LILSPPLNHSGKLNNPKEQHCAHIIRSHKSCSRTKTCWPHLSDRSAHAPAPFFFLEREAASTQPAPFSHKQPGLLPHACAQVLDIRCRTGIRSNPHSKHPHAQWPRRPGGQSNSLKRLWKTSRCSDYWKLTGPGYFVGDNEAKGLQPSELGT
jgi:hypothetical protein